jgi:hypothetical protein
MERFIGAATANAERDLAQIIEAIIGEANTFSAGRIVDDIAIIAARFL